MRETENNKRYKAAMQGVGMQNVKMQQEAADKGSLQVNVTSSVNSYPISEARISISYTGVPENTLEQLVTDSSGQTDMIELDAPPEEWSLDPENERQPYSEYTLNVSAPGFEPVSIAGTEILANTKAIQNIRMRPTDTGREEEEIFVIPAHTLYAEYPPKIAEDEIKPVNESGEIVLSRVVVPEYIVVHDGSPRDSTAKSIKIISKMWRPAKFMPPGPQIRFGQTFLRLCLLRSIAFIPNGIETKGMILRSLHLQHSIISGYRKEMYMKAFP